MMSIQLYAFGQITPDTSMRNRRDSTIQPGPTTTVQTFADKTISHSGEVYKLKAASDLPITVIGTGWSLYAFSKIYNKDRSS